MTEEIKVGAVDFGFDAGWIAEVVEKYGSDTLTLVVEAARNGLSVSLIMELLQRFGPALLEFAIDLMNQKNMQMAFVQGEEFNASTEATPAVIDVMIQKYLPIIVEKYLPVVLETYGPKIIQAIAELLIKNITK